MKTRGLSEGIIKTGKLNQDQAAYLRGIRDCSPGAYSRRVLNQELRMKSLNRTGELKSREGLDQGGKLFKKGELA